MNICTVISKLRKNEQVSQDIIDRLLEEYPTEDELYKYSIKKSKDKSSRDYYIKMAIMHHRQDALLYAHEKGYVESNFKELLELASNNGFSAAAFILGHMCVIECDGEGAIKWLTSAANQGLVNAQYELGYLYRQGINGFCSLDKSLYWLTRAAMNLYAPACYLLGKMYEKAEGVKKSVETAKKWYKIAAASPFTNHLNRANYALANLHHSLKQYDQAIKYWQNLSILGDRDAQYHLGCYYESGLATEKNLELAKKWFESSSEYNDEARKKLINF